MLLDATRHACNLHLDQALIVLFHEEHAPICPWFTVGIVGPLTPLPVFSLRSIGRSFAAGRRGAGGRARAVNPCSRLDCRRFSPASSPIASHSIPLSLPPSLLPPRSGRAPIQQLVPSLAVAIVSSSAEGRTRTDGRTGAESGWYTGRASKRVRCLPLLPLIKVASLPLHLSLHDERSERRSGGKNR